MKVVDIEKKSRRNIFKLFKEMDYPYVGITANVDVTKLVIYCKQEKYSFFKVFMYLVSKVCNTIKEFKYRFENNQIVEYDIVHPSYILKVQESS